MLPAMYLSGQSYCYNKGRHQRACFGGAKAFTHPSQPVKGYNAMSERSGFLTLPRAGSMLEEHKTDLRLNRRLLQLWLDQTLKPCMAGQSTFISSFKLIHLISNSYMIAVEQD